MKGVDNISCYWYSNAGDTHQCHLEANKIKPCYIHVPCYYFFYKDSVDDYIRMLLRENEQLKLMKVELP